MIASWPTNPVTASASKTQPWSDVTVTQFGHASIPAPADNENVLQNTSVTLASVRLSTRPAIADTA